MGPTESEAAEEYVDSVLRGRKLKNTINNSFECIRNKYEIKQIEIEVLLYFEKYPEAAASDVTRNLDLNKGYVSTALYDLCRIGYMISAQNRKNRRYVCYQITEKGQEVLREAKQIRETTLRRLFKDISDEEMEVLRTIAGKISRNIEELSKCS